MILSRLVNRFPVSTVACLYALAAWLTSWFAFSLADDPAPTLAVPAAPKMLDAGPFQYALNPATGGPLFVFEVLSQATMQGVGKRPGSFHADPQVPRDRQPSAADYTGSGWDIFHLPAAGNYGSTADKWATCMWTVTVPGDRTLNRGVWARIESVNRSLAKDCAPSFTLPLYEYRDQPVKTIGPSHVPVPTHFAKCTLVMADGEPRQMVAWLVPNRPPIATNINDYRVTVRHVEERTQLDLFSWLPDAIEEALETEQP